MSQQKNARNKWRYRAVVLLAVIAAAIPTVVARGSVDQGQKITERTGTATVPAGAARTVGGHARDYNFDQRPDLLARSAATGDLLVYPHSGRFQGTATYLPPVTVAHGWAGHRWIGPGAFTRQRWEDGISDLIGITAAGELVLAVNTGSGIVGGDQSFFPPEVIGTGWETTDLVFAHDFTGDHYTDLLARRAGTGDTYLYANKGSIGVGFEPPELVVSGGASDVWQGMADVTMDGTADLLFVQDNGILGAFSFADDATYVLGTGWAAIDAVVLADVDGDGAVDLLGRRTADGVLQAYRHGGTWQPEPDGTADDTYLAPQVIGYGWDIHDWLS